MAVSLECRDLCFSFQDYPVLDRFSFQIHSGRFCAVLGRNGSGKTTLIHCLNRILTPDSGKILINGQDISCMSRNWIARQISLVPQEHLDIFPYRVIDVVVMGRAPFLSVSARPGRSDYDMAYKALAALNAQNLGARNFNRISGGERQIVLLARAMTQSSGIMLLDEPTNHLDFHNQYLLLESIKSLCCTDNTTIVASMHDPNMAALFAHDVIMIKNHRIMAQGKAARVMTRENISRLYDTDIGQIHLSQDKNMFIPENILNPIPESHAENFELKGNKA